jgi:glycosyltransferase involved in cell wall biosynthesis
LRILILSQFFAPEARTAPTNLAALAADLQRSGHEVVVLTGFPNHPFGKIYEGYRQSLRCWDEIDGVRVLRVPLYADHSLSAVRRAMNYGSFALSASLIGAPLLRKFHPDVIFVYIPPLTTWLPLRIFRAMFQVPAVCWMTDLWPEALEAAGARLSPMTRRAVSRLEQATYNQLAVVCVNSPGIRRKLVEKGLSESKIEVIVDWADETIFRPAERDPGLAQVVGMAGKFNVVYGGNFGPAQGLVTAVEAAAFLADVPDFQLVLIGDGEEKPLLEAMVADRSLTNVLFIARQPMSEIYRFFALADALLMHLKPDPLYELQIPSKTMAYLACGRPILCAVSGDAAAVVEQAGAGVSSPPGDAAAMARAIRHMQNLPEIERRRMGERGREAHLAHYTRSVQVARLEQVLRTVAGSR